MGLAPSAYPKLLNIRSYSPLRLESRPGSVLVTAAPLDQLIVHSLKRLNNSIPGSIQLWTRVVGAGTKLYSGQTAITVRETGYSGNPLALVAYRPVQSPETWVYVGDSNKMSKINVGGTAYQMGVNPPRVAPNTTFGAPNLYIIERFATSGGWAWSPSTSITASNTGRLNTTISHILYDSGTVGWASIILTAGDIQLGAGAVITVGSEVAEVQSIHPSLGDTFTGALAYDGSIPGLATVYPSSLARSPWKRADSTTLAYNRTGVGITQGVIIRMGTEFAIVRSVTGGMDGTASFRVFLISSHVAGETIDTFTTLRVYLTGTHVVGEAVTSADFTQTIPAGLNLLSETGPLNLSQIAGRPTQDTDEFHLSIKLSDSSQLTEGRVMFDVDAATNDFTQNYYAYTFRANDFVPASQQKLTLLSTRQQAIQRSQVDNAGGVPPQQQYMGGVLPGDMNAFSLVPYAPSPSYQPPQSNSTTTYTPITGQTSAQTGTGEQQWTELHFKVSELQRYGTDTSRTFANVQAVGISLQLQGSVDVFLSSLTLQGTFGPDVGSTGDSYLFRYRYRSSQTGAVSPWSPSQRSGLRAHRQAIIASGISSTDPQVDKIDWARFGGSITRWITVGNGLNAAPSFTDVYQDSDIANSPLADLDTYRPFPTVDIPRQGSVNVIGTMVTWVTGDQFNTRWAPGTLVDIAGTIYTTYSYPQDPVHLELVESAGAFTGVPYLIRQPLLDAQPLPVLFGPYQNRLLAVGDPFQPGVLFTTKGNNPDAASEAGYIEITSPSEPLMSGCMWNEVPYVWSSERMFQIYPDPSGTNVLTYQQIGNLGIFSRWGLSVGPMGIFGLSRTGIWQTAGGPQTQITDPDLTLLFPHDGVAGQPVSLGSAIFQPPDFSQTTELRLDQADGHLKFRYLDTNGVRTTLVWNSLLNVWGPDTQAYGAVTGYQEEAPGVHSNLIGGADGNVYQESGTTDNGRAFQSEARMSYVGDGAFGYAHSRDGYLGLYSGAAVSLIVNVDGRDFTHVVPQTASAYRKLYEVTQAMKGKAWEWALVGPAPWKLFMNDCSFRIKAWAADSYQPFQPFAHIRRLTGGQ